MKYIRTKEGQIFEIENSKPSSIIICKPKIMEMLVAIDDKKYEKRKVIQAREIGKKHWKNEIVAQADTIEEMCDCYLIVRKGRFTIRPIEPYVCDKKEWDLKTKQLKAHIIETCCVYGAIWIELPNEAMRLEPVAKMNNEGELELL